MTPAFQIIVNGADATATIADRLISIEVIDEDDDKSDRTVILVDDRDDLVALPDMDAQIEIWLGYRETGLSLLGRYSVDGRGGEGPVAMLSIRATAADLKGSIRAPRTRKWEDRTLGDIVRTIAGETGLEPVVAAAIAPTRWPYLAQTAESNLHFLRRIASTLDATAKPAGGSLVVSRRGSETTAAGDRMPNGTLTRADLVEWSWDEEGREQAGRVEAEWGDPDRATRERVTVGSGDPALRLRHLYATEDEAHRAARAEHHRRQKGEVTLSAELARFAPELVAGAKLTMSGVSSKVDGEWHLQRVAHRLGADGLRTSIEAKRGAEQ